MPSPQYSVILYFILSNLARIMAAAVTPLCQDTINSAGGSIPDSIEPPLVSTEAIKEIQLALFLENLESSYLRNGLQNLSTWEVAGYPSDTTEIINKLAAQEEVHIATIMDLLDSYDTSVIAPCQYSFPVTSIEEFFALGDIIISAGISALIGLVERVSYTDPWVVKTISSIVTVKSRHDAFFRHAGGKVPNPAPFDTGINSIWAYNLALQFIVPGSCPTELPLPILPPLNVSTLTATSNRSSTAIETSLGKRLYLNTTVSPITTTALSELVFSWNPIHIPFLFKQGKQLFVGWANQLNKPMYTELSIISQGVGVTDIPQGLNGAVFAAVTSLLPDNSNDLALTTLAGPVVIPLS